jgi:hypothetical protein
MGVPREQREKSFRNISYAKGVFMGFLLLILQSFDWLAAFHVEFVQVILFIAV